MRRNVLGEAVADEGVQSGVFTRSGCSYRFMTTSRVVEITEGFLDAGGLTQNRHMHQIWKCCLKKAFNAFSTKKLGFGVERPCGFQ